MILNRPEVTEMDVHINIFDQGSRPHNSVADNL